jgi:serine/threonine protein kinase
VDQEAKRAYRIKSSGRSSSTPTSLSGYAVISVIADRGVTQILRLYDGLNKRDLVGKMLTPLGMRNRKLLRALQNEAKIGQRLSHPCLVKVIKLQPGGPRPHVIMEYWPGVPLDQMSPEDLALVDLKEVFGRVAECLDYVHSQGIVHRDLKPAHILVEPPAETRVIDFSVAREISGKWWLLGRHRDRTAGTPEYMSPEQTLGAEQDGRADIYGLGVVLFEVLTGRKPFMGEDLAQLMSQHRNSTPPPPMQLNPRVSRWASDLILRMLAKRPEDRPESMAEVVHAMRNGGPLLQSH